MQIEQLAKILPVPTGATSFHTEAGKAVFLIGSTASFEEVEISDGQADQLRAIGALGSFGQQIES